VASQLYKLALPHEKRAGLPHTVEVHRASTNQDSFPKASKYYRSKYKKLVDVIKKEYHA
jgi:hypothetical protein